MPTNSNQNPQRRKKTPVQVTLDGNRISGKKSKCTHCNKLFKDVRTHAKGCPKNLGNIPADPLNWDHINQHLQVKEFLIENPNTELQQEFNRILSSHGDLFNPYIQKLVNFARDQPKAHRDKRLFHKLEKDLTFDLDFSPEPPEQQLTHIVK